MSNCYLAEMKRKCILLMHHKESIAPIARARVRNKSIISRELHRNAGQTVYSVLGSTECNGWF